MGKTLEKHTEIERSIIKKFRKTIWNNFIGAVKEYELIAPGDKIAVCISGGKDSMLLAKCIQQLQRHSEIPFEAEYIVMDPGYNAENRTLIEHNAKLMDIPIYIFESDIFSVTERAGGSPCYLCAKMRRGCLYSKAKELGCNKIALGHHFNDVIETVLKFLQCACRFTENSAHNEGLSKRKEIKALIEDIKKVNPNVDDNIFRSIHNVNMATIPGWRDRDSGTLHSFTENY